MAVLSETAAAKSGEPSLKDRYDAVKRRVAEAARRAGRSEKDVVLVAVTKFASIDEVRKLIELGHLDFGENRVQNLIQRGLQIEEFLGRHRELGGRGDPLPRKVRWHMIGTIQRNKVRKMLPLTRLIHSVDSLRLAEEIQQAAVRLEEPVEVLVQANITGEKSKHGVAPAAVRHLIEQIETMMNVKCRGLMTMAEIHSDPQASRGTFELCKELFDDIRRSGIAGERFDILSMGMSQDFEVGIECGANVVRVGTSIFGEKPLTELETPEGE